MSSRTMLMPLRQFAVSRLMSTRCQHGLSKPAVILAFSSALSTSAVVELVELDLVVKRRLARQEVDRRARDA